MGKHFLLLHCNMKRYGVDFGEVELLRTVVLNRTRDCNQEMRPSQLDYVRHVLSTDFGEQTIHYCYLDHSEIQVEN